MGRTPCCDKNGLKKGPWTPEEDAKLSQYIQAHGAGNWRNLPKNAGLQRCGKSCRLRWTNYLRPDIKRGRFSFEEEETIIQLHSVLGNKWSAIAERLPGRTDNEIKNYWNTHIRKRLLRMGIDPVTHAPRLDLLDMSSLLTSPQLNLLRLQTLLNPEALRLAMSLAGDAHLLNSGQQLQLPNHDFENSNINNYSNFHNLQSPQPQSDQYQQLIVQDNLIPTANDHHQSVGYQFSDQIGVDFSQNSMTTYSNSNSSSSNNSNLNYMNDSVSLSSSPTLNSASALINGGGEEERETLFSNLLRFEIPEGLDFDNFM